MTERTTERFDSVYLHKVMHSAGVEITPTQLQRLEEYVYALIDTNKRLNLISRKDETEIWRNHILHSLSLLAIASLEPRWEFLDFGTGGGLPGVPLAILLPEARFILCDSIRKKVVAVEEIVSKLELKNVQCINARVEELSARYRNRVNAVLARAVTKLDALVQHSRHMIEPGGVLFAWKGGDISSEIQQVRRISSVLSAETIPIRFDKEPYFEREEKKIVQVILK